MRVVEDFILSGQIVYVAAFAMVVELVLLARLRQRTGRGPDLRVVAATLVSGGFFLISLHAAIRGGDAVAIAWPLVAAFAAHLAAVAAAWHLR